MFIDAKFSLEFDAKGFKGLQHHWQLDEMFSTAVFEAHDRNKNGKLDPEEVTTLRAEAFDNLKNYGWFTHILEGVDPTHTGNPQNFRAEWDGARLHYHFFLPLAKPAGVEDTYLIFALFDPTAFVSVDAGLKQAKIHNPAAIDVESFIDGINDLKPFAGLIYKQQGLYVRYRKAL